MSISNKVSQAIARYTAYCCLLAIMPQTPVLLAQSHESAPSLTAVVNTAGAELARKKGYQPGDLISRDDLDRVLKALAEIDWKPTDQKELIRDILPTNHPLVQLLSSRNGVRFMRKVHQDALIYDRMDRVSQVSGGRRMLSAIIGLPDGEKYARLSRPHGVPGFLDLLPKNASGKVRSIKDYSKPTGHIYTEQQLLERLAKSYRNET